VTSEPEEDFGEVLDLGFNVRLSGMKSGWQRVQEIRGKQRVGRVNRSYVAQY
jgi:hypothetical protein